MTQPSASSLRDMMNAVEQSPDLQEELRQWVLRLIRGSDGLREELRREILTEELLQLPVRFTKMEQDVGVLKDDVAGLKGRGWIEAGRLGSSSTWTISGLGWPRCPAISAGSAAMNTRHGP